MESLNWPNEDWENKKTEMITPKFLYIVLAFGEREFKKLFENCLLKQNGSAGKGSKRTKRKKFFSGKSQVIFQIAIPVSIALNSPASNKLLS